MSRMEACAYTSVPPKLAGCWSLPSILIGRYMWLFTSRGVAYPPRVKAATSFRAAYRKAYARDPSGIALQAFDATNVLLQAISRAIDDAGGKRPGRRQVLTAVVQTSYAGLMGTMGFDHAGDTTLKLVTVYQWQAPTATRGDFVTQVNVH